MNEKRLETIASLLHYATLAAFFAAGYGMGTRTYAWTVLGLCVVLATFWATRIIDARWPEYNEDPAGCCGCGTEARTQRYATWMDYEDDPADAEVWCRLCFHERPGTWVEGVTAADLGVIETIAEFHKGCRDSFPYRLPIGQVTA